MKRLRMRMVLVLTLAFLALALYWSPRRAGYATPTECLDRYGEAGRAGDVARYRSCLGEPLRSEMERRFPDAAALAEFLRASMKDIKSWVQLEPRIDGSAARVDVEEVRVTGQRRLRFQLARSGKGWLIVGIEQPQEVSPVIPYGTHISKVPEEASPK
jgi:hypothetical protein